MSFSTTLDGLGMTDDLFGEAIATAFTNGMKDLGVNVECLVENITQLTDIQLCIKAWVCTFFSFDRKITNTLLPLQLNRARVNLANWSKRSINFLMISPTSSTHSLWLAI